MGEIADLVRDLWPRVHAGHPGFNLERGECADCPLERERLAHEAAMERLASEMDRP